MSDKETNPLVHIIFPGNQPLGNGWGGVFKASIAHIQSLLAAGAKVVVWTASEAIAEAAKSAGAEVDYDPAWHRGLDPLWSPRCWKKAAGLRKRKPLGSLHEGGRTGLWGRLFFPGIPQAGVMHRERVQSYRTFKHLLCLSHGYKEQLQSCREGRRKITAVAPNALLELPSPQNKPRQIHNNPPVIGFVGRMEPVKGVDLLLEAAAIMKARSIDFRMVIAGGDPGRYRQQATALQLDSHVTFPGWCDNPTELYNTWDIFCLPSREEPFGLSLIEAMACGLPVVTTECNGPRDIVGTDGSGLIVPKNDVTALAVALTSLVLDSELRQKMGDNARRRVITHFSYQAVGHSLIQALKELRSK